MASEKKSQRLVPGSMYIPPTPTHLNISKASTTSSTNAVNVATSRAMTPNKQLGELLRSLEPSFCFQPAVEELLLDMATEFVNDVVSFSSRLSKHRRSTVLDAKDLQFCLAKNYGIALPGVLKPSTGSGQAAQQSTLSSLGSDVSVRPRSAKNSIHMHRVVLKRKLLQRTAMKLKKSSTTKVTGDGSSASTITKKIVQRKVNTDTVDVSK